MGIDGNRNGEIEGFELLASFVNIPHLELAKKIVHKKSKKGGRRLSAD